MKRFLLGGVCAAAIVLAGCASTGTTPEGAAVEDRTPGGAGATTQPVPPGGTGTQPIPPGRTGVDPLKDPSSPLSKRSVYFDFDSDAIREEFKVTLDAHARYLRDNRGGKVLIQGNADERGSREYNLGLGQRRADAVRRYLALSGVVEVQIESVSLGEEKPRCTERTEECYAQNRRADILHSGEF
ncbi:MAG: peptidoglycan-associated lipoprotein Pal [Burkholderiales bacterium]